MTTLPPLLAGPILRRTNRSEFTLWLATSVDPSSLLVELHAEQKSSYAFRDSQYLQLSSKLWLVQFYINHQLSSRDHVDYDIVDAQTGQSVLPKDICYSTRSKVQVQLSNTADHILHGSCRNPHHPSPDSLVMLDDRLSQSMTSGSLKDIPDVLLLTGDQIYADHIAGPTLAAIQNVIQLLELPDEQFDQSTLADSCRLHSGEIALYDRDKLLPRFQDDTSRLKNLLSQQQTAIFSSRDCENHLVSFSEFIAMYLLTWSPELWNTIGFDDLEPSMMAEEHRDTWNKEKQILSRFVQGLPKVRRLLAHIPTYMIFDDHDVTDDWNLTVGWEKAAYEHPFSKQIIGNALFGYLLCQAWGNHPEQMSADWQDELEALFVGMNQGPKQTIYIDKDQHQGIITKLLRYEKWHYTLDSHPKVVVLDTRTRRWRSESKINKPSGLMDWEAMVEFQQELLGLDAVVVVSPAPMFGVKFIETLQAMATKLGNPLIIDAENWMAHPGSANTLLSIFTHSKTPENFVILSGDVHYSFVYDVKLRFKQSDSHIYQITCSGIKNQFPEPLLTVCDWLDKWLYTPRSPLNWFTKRKRLKVFKRKPQPSEHNRLVNRCGIGLVKLDPFGKPAHISVLHGDGTQTKFPETYSED
ncbi:alkaline phosphatase D family protein [Vibrio sp. 10N]|uniref:alkaline phosphatase D family protein n=1 Tax=Vibrio sp. 10N TaxID=3058938 RepID=UPI002813F2F9|nr:alkaline phosphatase D family protein [Vibrio sp. 10N]